MRADPGLRSPSHAARGHDGRESAAHNGASEAGHARVGVDVDGDSASLAECCALLSALAQVPLTQTMAITGSMDLSAGLSANLSAEYADAAHAKDASSALNAFISLARATTGKQNSLFDAVQIEQSEATLRISAEAPMPALMQSLQ